MRGDIVAIILGRKVLRDSKNKNTMKILGKPHINMLLMLQKNKKNSKIYFSTDIEEIILNSKNLV